MFPLLLSLASLAGPMPADDQTAFCATGQPPEVHFLSEPRFPPPPDDGDKEIESWFEVGPSQEVSEHFVVHWGPQARFDADQAGFILDALEQAWHTYTVELGHPEPPDSDTLYVNVYVADSYAGAPAASTGTAYEARDPNRRSYLVFNAERLGDDPEWIRFVATHETYHAMQYAAGTWRDNYVYQWWIEATAQSMSARALRDDTWAIDRLHSFAHYPHLSINAYEEIDYDNPRSLHRYGAYLFVEELIAHSGEQTVVNTFTQEINDPLEYMRDELAWRGVDLDRVWFDTITHTITMDFPRHGAYAEHMEAHADLPDAALQVSFEVPSGGTSTMAWAPEATLPGAYGANIAHWADPDPGRYLVHIDLDDSGTKGTKGAGLMLELVTRSGDGPAVYTPLEVDGDEAHAFVEIPAAVDEAWIVIGVVGPRSNPLEPEVFAYTWWVESLPSPPATSGGCSQTGGAGLGWMLGFLPLILLRRKKR